MKINKDIRLGMGNVRQEQKQLPAGGMKFHELVQRQEHKMQVTQIQQLLGAINAAGERLAKSRNFRDMAKFKALVKQFVQETVDFGMELNQSHSWNQFGEGRPLKTVRTIDDKLVELAEALLGKEAETIDILDKIGEIKGLLINLYT
ncbi:YaaR family protein [Bacillus massilinigeriensis]|uniref:YaaR family protein n=1 Tax=Bacillus mediterraneensis TaxID=1805474 RepID=UPI0008F84AD1|nr:YaaR family protein [Bacillus mediterraneensis]